MSIEHLKMKAKNATFSKYFKSIKKVNKKCQEKHSKNERIGGQKNVFGAFFKNNFWANKNIFKAVCEQFFSSWDCTDPSSALPPLWEG